MLQNKVAVEQHGFHFREEVIVAIQIAPSRLHHAHLGIGEKIHRAIEELRRRAEIRVENRHQFARRRFQPFLQRPGLVPVAVGPVMILDRVAHVAVALHQGFGKRRGVVGGIVQHLDLQQLPRIVHLHHFVDQPLDYVAFVVRVEAGW